MCESLLVPLLALILGLEKAIYFFCLLKYLLLSLLIELNILNVYAKYKNQCIMSNKSCLVFFCYDQGVVSIQGLEKSNLINS